MKQNLLGLQEDSVKEDIIKSCLVLLQPAGWDIHSGVNSLSWEQQPAVVTSISGSF